MHKHIWLAIAATLFLASCANLSTINRQTLFADVGEHGNHPGQVVHLDVQQRLFITNEMGRFCAEPSPDAMASFAAALSASGGSPSNEAISAALTAGSQSSSIGLRTQSITLLRDTLYRMCEAYNNGKLTDSQVMTLLGRSQDLTAVILAVEQLTGTVSASQSALTTTASADAFAVATGVAKLLEFAVKRKQVAEERLTAADEIANQRQAEITKARRILSEAKTALDANPGGASEQREHAERQEDLELANSNHSAAVKSKELRNQEFEAAKAAITKLENTLESSSATASAGTTGEARFATAANAKVLSQDASVAVATAVKEMVSQVLTKSYIPDYCVAILENTRNADRRTFCENLLLAVAIIDAEQGDANVGFSVAKSRACLVEWIAEDVANRDRLKDWLEQKSISAAPGIFGLQPRFDALRSVALEELRITCR